MSSDGRSDVLGLDDTRLIEDSVGDEARCCPGSAPGCASGPSLAGTDTSIAMTGVRLWAIMVAGPGAAALPGAADWCPSDFRPTAFLGEIKLLILFYFPEKKSRFENIVVFMLVFKLIINFLEYLAK